MKSILILSEVGDGIGLGHFYRCISLSSAFEKRGWKVRLIFDVQGTPDIEGNFENRNWRKTKIIGNYSIVIVDSYLADAHDYEQLRENTEFLVAVDDFNRINYLVDAIVNPGLTGYVLEYPKFRPLITGQNSILLRDEIRENCSKKVISKTIKKILISIGGTDPFGYIPVLINELHDKYQLEVLCGASEYKNELHDTYKNFENVNLIGVASASILKVIFNQVDVAISAGGQTLHELAINGVPIIPICIGDDQIPNLLMYQKMGLFPEFGMYLKGNLLGVVSKSILRMDEHERARISKLGQALIGNNGPHDVAKRLIGLMNLGICNLNLFSIHDIKVQSYETMSEKQAKEVLGWRNHEKVRTMMHNSSEISWIDHQQFCDSLSLKKNTWYWRLDHKNEGVGVGYLTKIDEENRSCELGLFANNEASVKNKGTVLLSVLLRICFEALGLKTCKLEVKQGNDRAIGLYQKFGFVRTQEKEGLVFMQLVNP